MTVWKERPEITHPPVPPPADADDVDLEARVRMKLTMREPLTREEKEWFRRMPGDKQP